MNIPDNTKVVIEKTQSLQYKDAHFIREQIIMKSFSLLLLSLLFPLSGMASALLGNCDRQPYDIIIRQGSSQRIVTLGENSGSLEVFGPQVSFQINSLPGEKVVHPIVNVTEQDAEYCIWSGKIKIQKLDRFHNNGRR